MRIAPALVGFDFKQCEADPCIFVHTNDKGEKTYIALYVDDLLIAGETMMILQKSKRHCRNNLK
jgi:hypothetical protein